MHRYYRYFRTLPAASTLSRDQARCAEGLLHRGAMFAAQTRRCSFYFIRKPDRTLRVKRIAAALSPSRRGSRVQQPGPFRGHSRAAGHTAPSASAPRSAPGRAAARLSDERKALRGGEGGALRHFRSRRWSRDGGSEAAAGGRGRNGRALGEAPCGAAGVAQPARCVGARVAGGRPVWRSGGW